MCVPNLTFCFMWCDILRIIASIILWSCTNMFLIYTQNWLNFGFDLLIFFDPCYIFKFCRFFTYSSFLHVWPPNFAWIYYRTLVLFFNPNFCYHHQWSNFASIVDNFLEFSIFILENHCLIYTKILHNYDPSTYLLRILLVTSQTLNVFAPSWFLLFTTFWHVQLPNHA